MQPQRDTHTHTMHQKCTSSVASMSSSDGGEIFGSPHRGSQGPVRSWPRVAPLNRAKLPSSSPTSIHPCKACAMFISNLASSTCAKEETILTLICHITFRGAGARGYESKNKAIESPLPHLLRAKSGGFAGSLAPVCRLPFESGTEQQRVMIESNGPPAMSRDQRRRRPADVRALCIFRVASRFGLVRSKGLQKIAYHSSPTRPKRLPC